MEKRVGIPEANIYTHQCYLRLLIQSKTMLLLTCLRLLRQSTTMLLLTCLRLLIQSKTVTTNLFEVVDTI